MRRLATTALALASAVLLLALPARAQDVIKIAAGAPLTGPLAKQGQEVANSVKLAVEQWNAKGGIIKHTGGLSLSTDDTMLTLTNYFIDLRDMKNPVLTAIATVNGDTIGRIQLFDLGAAPVQAGCAATASLSLASEAAGALTMIFGAPNLTGKDFGDACVAPR